MALTAAVVGASPSTVAQAATTGTWLDEVNKYRVAAGAQPAVENSAWTTGLLHHFAYIENTPADLRTGQYANLHSENPASPWYTVDGAEAGSTSDLGADVDGFLIAPIHALGILNPRQREMAFASDGTWSGLRIYGGTTSYPPLPGPTLFPGNGMTTNLYRAGGEVPNTLESCPSTFVNPVGLELIAALTSAPDPALTATLTGPGGPWTSSDNTLCVIDEHTYHSTDAVYGPTGLALLTSYHAVVLAPKSRLRQGTYTATISQPSQPDITWSFTEEAPPPEQPDAPSNSSATATGPTSASVAWTASAYDGGSPITSYSVNSADYSVGCTTTTPSATSCIVSDLKPGIPYKFYVTANNAVGSSWTSDVTADLTLPDIQAPTLTITPLLTTTLSTSRLTWSVTDDSGGPTWTDLRMRTVTWAASLGPWLMPTGLQNLATTAATVRPGAGSTVCYGARAKDLTGNVSTWSRTTCTVRPLDDRSLTRGSGWTRSTRRGSYAGTVTSATKPLVSLVRTGVVGGRFGILATHCPTCGTVQLFLGSRLLTTVNLRSSRTALAVLTLAPRIPTARGTLTIRTSSSGKLVQVDGLYVSP